MESLEFYNVKKREKVTLSDYTKVKYTRETEKGTQTRYAFRGEDDGTKVTKFCSKADWDASAAAEVTT